MDLRVYILICNFAIECVGSIFKLYGFRISDLFNDLVYL
jgi:hypothetical protein